MIRLRPAPHLVGLIAAFALAGCTDFPELDRKVDPAVLGAPYPPLLPFDAVTPPPPPPATIVQDLTAQGAALTARANAQNSQP